LKFVGPLLTSFQGVLDALGQAISGEATERGVVPEAIRAKTQMSIVTTFASSFGVELAGDALPDLFGNSLANDALKAFSALLAAKSERDQLRTALNPLQVRSAVRYREFLRCAADSQTTLTFQWASPKQRALRVEQLTSGQAGVAARVISEFESVPPEEYRIEGTLTMGDVLSQRFTLTAMADGKKFTGKVSKAAAEEFSHATLNERYSALIRELRSTTTVLDNESTAYELIELQALDMGVAP
jgi:hypothetical protein